MAYESMSSYVNDAPPSWLVEMSPVVKAQMEADPTAWEQLTPTPQYYVSFWIRGYVAYWGHHGWRIKHGRIYVTDNCTINFNDVNGNTAVDATWPDDFTPTPTGDLWYVKQFWEGGDEVEYSARDGTWGQSSLSNGMGPEGDVGGYTHATELYIDDSNIEFTLDGRSPVGPERLFCNRDGKTIIFGVGATKNSNKITSQYGVDHWITNDFSAKFKWISPVDSHAYEVPINSAYYREYSETRYGGPGVPHNKFYCNVDTYKTNLMNGLHCATGTYDSESEVDNNYDAQTPFDSTNTIALQWLMNQAGCTEQDMYTFINCEFYKTVGAGTVLLYDTLTVDFTDLFDSGEDIYDLDRGKGDPHYPNDEDNPNTDNPIQDQNNYVTHIDLTVPTITTTGVFNRCYAMDIGDIADLADFLYNADDDVFEEIIDGVLTRGNPIESLIDLRLYPFDIVEKIGHGTAEFIKFGRTTTGISGMKLPNNANAVIDLGHAQLVRYWSNYLDYATTVELYIPFCGVGNLPIERVLNKDINVKMIVDLNTGACTAVVYADTIPIQYRQGIIGITIPMTATTSAEFGKAVLGNLIQTGTSIASGAMAGASAGGSAAGSSAVANYKATNPFAKMFGDEYSEDFYRKQAGYNSAYAGGAVKGGISGGISGAGGAIDFMSMLHDGSSVQQVGSSSPQVSLFQPKNCYMLITRPVVDSYAYGDDFARLVGYTCFIPGTVGSHNGAGGLCTYDNVKMDISGATEAEKAEILSLLTTGIFQ